MSFLRNEFSENFEDLFTQTKKDSRISADSVGVKLTFAIFPLVSLIILTVLSGAQRQISGAIQWFPFPHGSEQTAVIQLVPSHPSWQLKILNINPHAVGFEKLIFEKFLRPFYNNLIYRND